MKYDVKDINLAPKGLKRIEWAAKDMKVLYSIQSRFEKEKPLKGIKIAACLHVTTETANLMLALKAGGAEVSLCASNPLSTQDDVAASLVKDFKISVYAIKAEDNKRYYKHITSCLGIGAQITMDDGADLVSMLHKEPVKFGIETCIGGTEETTTGVIRLRSMQDSGVLQYPIIAINDAQTKYMFDNRYGTGQSTIDGILRSTNSLIAGSVFVVCGYGWCGRGVAMRARGMGAKVVVTEVNPVRALEATMDGFQVLEIKQAAKVGDIFLTTTGDISVIDEDAFLLMKDGAILANSGHFNVEIDINALKKLSKSVKPVKDFVQEFTIRKTGKKIYLLGEGRLINLAAAEGHPAQVMDMSFANQALCVEYIVANSDSLTKKVYSVPKEIDEKVASLKLASMGIKIDKLTEKQKKYLASWQEGT